MDNSNKSTNSVDDSNLPKNQESQPGKSKSSVKKIKRMCKFRAE